MIQELTEIPDPIDMTGWKDILIKECGEPLIVLNGLDSRIEVSAEYYRQEIPLASSTQRLRQGAAERLIQSTQLLPSGYKLVVFDAHRPLEVQKSLFDTQIGNLRQQNQDWSQEKLEEETQRYVSIPSDNPTKPSPHSTGGAIDLSILDQDGRLLNMGTVFDHFGIEARTAYFKNLLTNEEIHRNRQLLYTVMTEAGFTNYPEEWWHFDYGNQFWGKILEKDAIYNLAKLDELNGSVKGAIKPEDNSIIFSVRADGPVDMRGRRFGIAGSSKEIEKVLSELNELYNKHFPMKEQLAQIIIRRHGLHRFAI